MARPLHHPDHDGYRHFSKPSRVHKAVNTLHGLVKGIAIDNELNGEEAVELVKNGVIAVGEGPEFYQKQEQ